MNRKRIRILLVVLAILIGGVAVFTFFVNDRAEERKRRLRKRQKKRS